MVLELIIKNEEKLKLKNRTSAKASSQGIQRDQFRNFWSSVQEVFEF